MTSPLPTELTTLISIQKQLESQLDSINELRTRLSTLLHARTKGNGRMQMQVDLGMGFSIEGVVEDTSTMTLNVLDDLWLEIPVDQADTFLRRKEEILSRRDIALKERIKKLKEDYQLVAKTLRKALEIPDEEVEDGR